MRTPWREGYPIDVPAMEAALRADTAHAIVAVFVVHTDTASGMTSDLAGIRQALDAAAHPALLVVDVVASLGAAPFAMDALGANVVLGASQKGLMVPPGLAFVAADAAAMKVRRGQSLAALLLGLGAAAKPAELPQVLRHAAAKPALRPGGRAGPDFHEGVEQVIARHRMIAGAVHAAVEAWSEGGALSLFVREPAARSVSVTTVSVGRRH